MGQHHTVYRMLWMAPKITLFGLFQIIRYHIIRYRLGINYNTPVLPGHVTSPSYTRPRIGGAVYFDCLVHESPYEDVQDWSIESIT